MENMETTNTIKEPIAKENVATLLPQVGINGSILNKDGVDNSFEQDVMKDVTNTPVSMDDLDLSESVVAYITNPEAEYDISVEEGVKDTILNFKTKIDVSRQIRKAVLDVYILEAKIKHAEKMDTDKKKIIDLKRELVQKRKELNSYKNSSTAELKKEIKDMEKTAKTEADKEIQTDNVTESCESIDFCDDDVYTEMFNAHKGKKAYFLRTEKKYNKLVEKMSSLKNKNTSAEKKLELAKEASDIISELILEASKIPDDGFVDSIADINFFINGLKKFFAVFRAYFTITKVIVYKPKTQRGTVIAGLQKLQNDVNKEILKATKELGKENYKAEVSEVKESVDIIFEAGNTNELPPELKRLDEIRGRIEELEDEKEVAAKKLGETGDNIYEKKIKGLTAKIEKLKSDLKADEEKAKKIEKEMKESVTITEKANLDPEMKPIVDKLNSKGYKVKYASPGHEKLRKSEDGEPDGVYYNKLYSDARIMFDKKYPIDNDAPKYWHWREVDGCSYLDITPEKYDEKSGDTPDEAFKKWKINYMNSLRTFVDDLGKEKSSNNDKDEEDVKEESVIDFYSGMSEIMESISLDTDIEIPIEVPSSAKILDELDNLLS